MKIEVNILIEVLQRKITQIRELPKAAQKEVEQWMLSKYNIPFGTTADIFAGKTPLEIQSYDMLYKLTKSIHSGLTNSKQERWKEIDLSELNVNTYFTVMEIKEFEQPIQKRSLVDEDIVRTEWFQLNIDQYSSRATIDEIIQWRDLNKVYYNEETQRDLIVKDADGIKFKTIDINDDAVNDMFKLMKNNEFFSDDITLNINTDINTKSEQLIKIVNGKLVIPKESQIDILDGFHRLKAMCLVKDLYPDWKFVCGIKFVMFDTEKANQYMLQQDKKTHLRPKQTKRINKNDEANFIIDKLNRSSRFNLKGKINSIMWADLNDIINDIFKPTQEKREKSLEVYNLLEENLNRLVEEKKYFNKEFTKDELFIYLYLIYKSEDKKIEFMQLVNNIDVNKLLDQIKIKNKPTSKHYRLLNDLIKEVM